MAGGFKTKFETSIWIICVFGLSTLTVYQLLPLFEKFLKDPPVTTVVIHQNNTMSLPPAAVCLLIGNPPTFQKDDGIYNKHARYNDGPMSFWAQFLLEDRALDAKCPESLLGANSMHLAELCTHRKSKIQFELDSLQKCNEIKTIVLHFPPPSH